jgi:hypothetical protein
MYLFHLSPIFHGKTCRWLPRVPPNRADFEDSTTPRICFSPSIKGCLLAADFGGFNIRDCQCYALNSFPILLKPVPYLTKNHTNTVFDSADTHEVWALEPVDLLLIGTISHDQGFWDWEKIYYKSICEAADLQDNYTFEEIEEGIHLKNFTT